MDEGIRMVLIIVKNLLIKPFRVFDKFDSRIKDIYIHVVMFNSYIQFLLPYSIT